MEKNEKVPNVLETLIDESIEKCYLSKLDTILLIFELTDGEYYGLYHPQEDGETVDAYLIEGDLKDLEKRGVCGITVEEEKSENDIVSRYNIDLGGKTVIMETIVSAYFSIPTRFELKPLFKATLIDLIKQ